MQEHYGDKPTTPKGHPGDESALNTTGQQKPSTGSSAKQTWQGVLAPGGDHSCSMHAVQKSNNCFTSAEVLETACSLPGCCGKLWAAVRSLTEAWCRQELTCQLEGGSCRLLRSLVSCLASLLLWHAL